MAAPQFYAPWRWQDNVYEGKLVATFLVTDYRPIPCNDPVIFAIREDWLGPQTPDREAAKNLILAAPNLYNTLTRLVEWTRENMPATAAKSPSVILSEADDAIAKANGLVLNELRAAQ